MAIRRSAAKRHGLPSVVQLRLTPTPAQADALTAAMRLCNQAATFVSRLAWQQRTFTVLELHRLAYHPARAHVAGLGAQAAVRAIARVAGAYANRPGHADHIAARNIAARGVAGWAVVNQPHATGLPSARRDRESKPPALTGGS